MQIYNGFDDPRLLPKPRAAAIGVFDGVHRGHRKILNHALKEAGRLGASSMVVTFDPHPARVLGSGRKDPSVILSLAHRLRCFEQLGFSETLVIRFNKRFSRRSAEFFLNEIIVNRLGVKSLAVGKDFRFGHRAAGDVKCLRRFSRRLGFRLLVVPALRRRRETISSTRIREQIEKGDLKEAAAMLGRPVSVYGSVIRGRGRGRRLGFPTANLDPHHEALPPAGVYAALGRLGRKRLKGVIHIGQKPTFGDRQKSLEVHFLNFRGSLYGKELELIFVSRLRGTRRFAGPRQLAAAIQKDAKEALKVLYKTGFRQYN